MANWKKVITENDNSTHKNESITLAQLFAGLDASSTASANQILKVNSDHSALEWAADDDATSLGSLTNVTDNIGANNAGVLVVGSGSGAYTVRAVTGDVSVSGQGAITIGDDKVTYAKMQDTSTNNRVLGAGTAGTIAEVQVATDMVADDAITYAKMQHIATNNRVLGATTAGAVTEVQVQTAMIADDAVTSAKLDTNIDISGTLDVTSTATFDSDVAILGKLTMTGDIDTVSVTDLDVADKTITLASSSTVYADQNAMLAATNGAGISLQNQYDSGNVSTEAANMSASITWNNANDLSGWAVKDFTNVPSVAVAVMDFQSSSGQDLSGVNASGVGSFSFNTADDELYIRVS